MSPGNVTLCLSSFWAYKERKPTVGKESCILSTTVGTQAFGSKFLQGFVFRGAVQLFLGLLRFWIPFLDPKYGENAI